MSSRSTILLTSDEHWYHESVDPRDSVVLVIDKNSILEQEIDEDGILVYLKPDSELAKLLWHPEVKALLNKLSPR